MEPSYEVFVISHESTHMLEVHFASNDAAIDVDALLEPISFQTVEIDNGVKMYWIKRNYNLDLILEELLRAINLRFNYP